MNSPRPSALVVYESMFDNTERVAHAIVRGLQRSGFDAHCAPVTSLASTGPVQVDLLLVGAPTHAFSLSRRSTRSDAVRQGAPAEREAVGVREWIRQVEPQLNRAERRVAQAVLADIDRATRSSTKDLAQRAEVSEPTVIRFARHVGCAGFADLKRRVS